MEDIILNYIGDFNEEIQDFFVINYFNSTIYKKKNIEEGTFTMDKNILQINWNNRNSPKNFIKNNQNNYFLIFNSVEKIKKIDVYHTLWNNKFFLISENICKTIDNEYTYNLNEDILTINNEIFINLFFNNVRKISYINFLFLD